MINKFQAIATKLEWSLPVQIETFIRISPISFKQFVISTDGNIFGEIDESIKLYQEFIEV